MSTGSFGKTCDDWTMGNPDYECANWNYELEDDIFKLEVKRKYPLEKLEGQVISAKAAIPDSTALTEEVVAFVLNILAAQVKLYEDYGIKI